VVEKERKKERKKQKKTVRGAKDERKKSNEGLS
jgi:hypothetical protein